MGVKIVMLGRYKVNEDISDQGERSRDLDNRKTE